MMNDKEYFQYIKNEIRNILESEYDNIIHNKSELERENKNTIATLIAIPIITDNIAYNLKNWSYSMAGVQMPDIARKYLTKGKIKADTMNYVKELTNQMNQMNQINQMNARTR